MINLQISNVKMNRSKYKKKQQATSINELISISLSEILIPYLKISLKHSSNSGISNNYIKKLYLKNYPLGTYVKYLVPNYF